MRPSQTHHVWDSTRRGDRGAITYAVRFLLPLGCFSPSSCCDGENDERIESSCDCEGISESERDCGRDSAGAVEVMVGVSMTGRDVLLTITRSMCPSRRREQIRKIW